MNINLSIVFASFAIASAEQISWNPQLNQFGANSSNSYEPRIIGGSDTTIYQFPYQVAILRYGYLTCGGSIISEKWIISAAHCFDLELPIEPWRVRSGSNYFDKHGTLHKIRDIIRHERFRRYSFGITMHDIAVVKVTPRFEFYERVPYPVTLLSRDEKIKPGIMAYVTGWGITEEDEYYSVSDVLQKALVPIHSSRTCQEIYWKDLKKGQLCAGYMEGGTDACQGDSGGPLTVMRKLIGIVSWGTGCGRSGYPGVYTDASSYRDWIYNKTGV